MLLYHRIKYRGFEKLEKYLNIIALPILMIGFSCATADQLAVGDFSNRGLAEWKEHSFNGNTEYRLTELDGVQVIEAVSRASASVLIRKLHVDLEATPYLYWRWRIKSTIEGANETVKSGDDYPARIYIVNNGGLFPWQKRSVNYVWASKQPQDAAWPSAYTPLSQMIALRSGSEKAGRWLEERRNVREDFRNLFDKDIRYINLIALMTDTDNTGEEATAYYGDIFFSDE